MKKHTDPVAQLITLNSHAGLAIAASLVVSDNLEQFYAALRMNELRDVTSYRPLLKQHFIGFAFEIKNDFIALKKLALNAFIRVDPRAHEALAVVGQNKPQAVC